MAEKIFLGLNGLGLVFLLFVFVEFLKEGRRTKVAAAGVSQRHALRGSRPDSVIAVVPPEGEAARLMRRRLIQFRARKSATPESRLAGKLIELDSTIPTKGYGAR